MAAKGFIVVDEQNCKGCELCATVCPTKTIGFAEETNGKGYHFAKMVNDSCIACQSCALVCPDSIITVYKAKK